MIVASGDPPATRGQDLRGLWDFARAWAQAMDGTSYVPMTHVEIEEFLFVLAGRLAAALRAEPNGSTAPGYEIGAGLVAAGFDSPEGLGRTVGVIHDRLLSDLGFTGNGPRHRLTNLLETLIAGHSRAMRDRTLDEQEEIRCAALVARGQAQQALRASEARFRYEAMHDPLTGLPNRALFADRLDQIFTHPQPEVRLGVCFVDLDGFKAVNDSFGHHVGDHMLVAVSERLGGFAAESGHLIARLGGDEFVILVESTDDETLHTLQALADFGVRLAVDDFGTGYSNLAYLRALPVHGLKLAGSFMQGLRSPGEPDPTDVAILTTLVSLGRTLGLTITAEGIETAIQADRVRTIGCDLGQGWHFGRPQPDDRLPRLTTSPGFSRHLDVSNLRIPTS